jgi:hypothetical protein
MSTNLGLVALALAAIMSGACGGQVDWHKNGRGTLMPAFLGPASAPLLPPLPPPRRRSRSGVFSAPQWFVTPGRGKRERVQTLLRGCASFDSPSQPPWRPKLQSPALVLVGSEGAGRRSLARGLAERLGIRFFDCLEMPSEAEAGLLEGICQEASSQARGLAAVVTSTGANAGAALHVRQVLERAKAQGHLIVHVQRFPEAGDATEVQAFDRALSSHRFCALDYVASSTKDDQGAPHPGSQEPADAAREWERLRSLELALDDLHVMVHRLVYAPPVLLLGSTSEPLPHSLLSASHTSSPLALACASDVVQLRVGGCGCGCGCVGCAMYMYTHARHTHAHSRTHARTCTHIHTQMCVCVCVCL